MKKLQSGVGPNSPPASFCIFSSSQTQPSLLPVLLDGALAVLVALQFDGGLARGLLLPRPRHVDTLLASFKAEVTLISFSDGVSPLLAFLVSMIPTSSLIPWAF